MIVCPECGKKTTGKTNNRKQLRCEFCYAILPPPKAEVKTKPLPVIAQPETEKPKEKQKPVKRPRPRKGTTR